MNAMPRRYEKDVRVTTFICFCFVLRRILKAHWQAKLTHSQGTLASQTDEVIALAPPLNTTTATGPSSAWITGWQVSRLKFEMAETCTTKLQIYKPISYK